MIYVLRKAEQRPKLPGMEPEDQEAKQAIAHLGAQGVKAELVKGSGGKLLRVPMRDAKRMGVTPVSYGGGKAVVAVEDVPGRKLKKGGPYIGPRGGKYKDPQHKIPYKEESAVKVGLTRPKGEAKNHRKITTTVGKLMAAGVLGRLTVDDLNQGVYPGTDIKIRKVPADAKVTLHSWEGGGMVEDDQGQWIADRIGPELGHRAANQAMDQLQGDLPEVEATLIEETPEVEAEMVGHAPRARKKPEQMALFGNPTQGEIPGLGKSYYLRKAGPYIGPRGGEYQDPQHKIPWEELKAAPKPESAGAGVTLSPTMVKQAIDQAKAMGIHAEVQPGSDGSLLRLSGGSAARLGVTPTRYDGTMAVVRATEVMKKLATAPKKQPPKLKQVGLGLEEGGQLELFKAEARGGSYHRRVPRKSGKGYAYYYDEEKYKRSKGAHLDGEGAAKARIRSTVDKAMEAEGSCPVERLKSLVKRYGAQMVGDVCKAGGYQFKKGKLYPKVLEKEGTFSNGKSGRKRTKTYRKGDSWTSGLQTKS